MRRRTLLKAALALGAVGFGLAPIPSIEGDTIDRGTPAPLSPIDRLKATIPQAAALGGLQWSSVKVLSYAGLYDADGNLIFNLSEQDMVGLQFVAPSPFGEVSCIAPVPLSVLDDPNYDVWAEVSPLVNEAYLVTVAERIVGAEEHERAALLELFKGLPEVQQRIFDRAMQKLGTS